MASMPELVKPESEEIELTTILRWEDDGGKVIQVAEPAKIVRSRIDGPGTQRVIRKEYYDRYTHDRSY
jgi:hypothetical protein